jgi:two-component system, chemotaxis family, protein-glutamate methylesterase/glutaminase
VNKIRVLVVDDSAFNRKVLTEMLSSSRRIEVVGKAFDGEDAIRKIVQLNPDVLTLDLEMPGMDGFAVLRWLMANRPLPVLVVSSRESNRSVFKALDLGAVDFVVKPSKLASTKLRELEHELVDKVLAVPQLRFEKIRKRVEEAPEIDYPVALPRGSGHHMAEVIAIAASTGGPPAVQTVLSQLPSKMVSPIIVCQHMPPIFTRLFAERLASLTGRVVKEATDRELLFPGHVYVAPGEHHVRTVLVDAERRLAVAERSEGDRFAPSADVLFQSVAEVYGRRCLGVVLTGMGDDGKIGALAIHKAKGRVIAEAEETAVIYGMPREVVRAKAADHVLPLGEIAGYLVRYGLLAES